MYIMHAAKTAHVDFSCTGIFPNGPTQQENLSSSKRETQQT